ncbi:phosphatase PAP2 family protein [uncultured Tenacibaculum sp.]|uniref:phosphatase PAP2 family protein n=1 Tax=uncultured Tenacibaculum sp. TaxID=174713 RepID=UPI0026191CE0|nr:phosphatase PAP2 family protein [uncultured Tenacibaculum sp.]
MTRKVFFKLSLILVFLSGNSTIQSQAPLNSSQQFHKTSGDVLVGLLPAIALTSTFIWQDEQKGTLQFTKSFVSTVAVTSLLKLIIDKERPNGESLNSFPSGHTSISFASATFIQKRYGWKYGIPAYIFASYVGFSRIEAKKHDGWDVLAGAAIGYGFSYLFTKPYDKNAQIQITSGMLDDTPTFGFRYTF